MANIQRDRNVLTHLPAVWMDGIGGFILNAVLRDPWFVFKIVHYYLWFEKSGCVALAFALWAWASVVVSEVASGILAILSIFYLKVTKLFLSIKMTLIGLFLTTATWSVYREKYRREKHLLKIVLLDINYVSTKESYAKQGGVHACPL